MVVQTQERCPSRIRVLRRTRRARHRIRREVRRRDRIKATAIRNRHRHRLRRRQRRSPVLRSRRRMRRGMGRRALPTMRRVPNRRQQSQHKTSLRMRILASPHRSQTSLNVENLEAASRQTKERRNRRIARLPSRNQKGSSSLQARARAARRQERLNRSQRHRVHRRRSPNLRLHRHRAARQRTGNSGRNSRRESRARRVNRPSPPSRGTSLLVRGNNKFSSRVNERVKDRDSNRDSSRDRHSSRRRSQVSNRLNSRPMREAISLMRRGSREAALKGPTASNPRASRRFRIRRLHQIKQASRLRRRVLSVWLAIWNDCSGGSRTRLMGTLHQTAETQRSCAGRRSRCSNGCHQSNANRFSDGHRSAIRPRAIRRAKGVSAAIHRQVAPHPECNRGHSEVAVWRSGRLHRAGVHLVRPQAVSHRQFRYPRAPRAGGHATRIA